MRLLALAVLLFSPVLGYAQTDPIDASRKIDWTSSGVTGGITDRTTICDTLTSSATAAQINTAIAGCASGQVVFLEAGTYSLTTGLVFNDKSNVTLRGAGPDQTKLVFTGADACGGINSTVCVKNGQLNHKTAPGNTANWTAGYAKGTTVITVDSTTNMQVGTVLILDQLNDTNTDTGELWVCETDNICGYEGPGGGSRLDRAQVQLVKVTVIDGSDITISPGLHMPNWRTGRDPEAWWSSDTPIVGVGIEELKLDHTDASNQSGIGFYNAYDSWVKNIASIKSERDHVWLFQSARLTVRDSYFYWTKATESLSYGVEGFVTSDCLVENNIFERVASPLIINGSTSGNVYGYNYTFDNEALPATWMFDSISDHAAGMAMNLHEGNDVNGWSSDSFHGTRHFDTIFRNRLHGWETGKTNVTHGGDLQTFARFHNAVGNIMGTSTYHTIYERATPAASADDAVWVLGFSRTPPNPPHDTLVEDTLFRWGNCDTVTDTCRFESSEVPSGLSKYANPVPGDQTLIDSYYLASRPGFFDTAFGAVPWPPIGPDITGGDDPDVDVGGFSNKIPARLCFENTSRDGDSILIFNADNCYEGSTSGASISGTVTLSGAVKIQ
jgi:hypothetical protein